ncbi:MAG TPA: PQQ-binding-like beta-propeller repeat protein [Candidatus Lokiarchaeia archaeon]
MVKKKVLKLMIIFFVITLNLNALSYNKSNFKTIQNEKSSYMMYLETSGATLLWNYTTGDDVNSVAISSDGNYISVGSSDNSTYLLNISSSYQKKAMWNYTTGDIVKTVSIADDIPYFVAGSNDGNLYLLNITDYNSKKPLWNCTMGKNIRSIAISSNGNYIIAGSDLKLSF